MKKRAESVEELFPLMEACKAGDLKFVGQWIADGKSLDFPAGKRTRRRSPLEIAIEKGFLTLAKTPAVLVWPTRLRHASRGCSTGRRTTAHPR
jgi:hypothetical protein